MSLKATLTNLLTLTITVTLIQACSISQPNSSRDTIPKEFVIRSCPWEGVQFSKKPLDFVVIQRPKHFELDLCHDQTCVRLQTDSTQSSQLQQLCQYSVLYLYQQYRSKKLRLYANRRHFQVEKILRQLKIRNQIDCFKILEQKKGVCRFSDVASKNALEIFELDTENRPHQLRQSLDPSL